ncbi:MAG: cheZ, partial [Massilia sp.]|nr:cheZ [Massilia sp.]
MTDAADDFDALFDEVSAQRDAAPAAVAPTAAAPAAAAAVDEDDFEALFDQVAAQSAPAPAPAAEGDAHTEGNAADKPMFERLGGIVR